MSAHEIVHVALQSCAERLQTNRLAFHRVADDLGLRRPGCVESAAKVSWQEPSPKDPNTQTEGNQMRLKRPPPKHPRVPNADPKRQEGCPTYREDDACLGWPSPPTKTITFASLFVGHPSWRLGSALGTPFPFHLRILVFG